MSKYTFKFKYKNETRYLYLPITATVFGKAIDEAIDFIKHQKKLGKIIEKGILEEHIETKEIVWEVELENYKDEI